MTRTVLFQTFCMVLLACLIAASCRSVPSRSEPEPRFIRCGQGGGFTGEESGFEVDHTGAIFILKDLKKVSTGKRLSQERLGQLWENVELLRLDEENFMMPGNTYKFIEIDENGVVNRMAWKDSPREEAPEGLIRFHRIFKHTVTQQR